VDKRRRNVRYFIRKVYQLLKRRCGDVFFIVRNVYSSFFLKKILEKAIDEHVIIRGASIKDLREALHIYSIFNNKNGIGFSRYIVYIFISRKMVFVARDITAKKIIGTELYYFNRRDIKENTIHQGFRGILPPWQGRGIGTLLTSHAVNHFKNSRLDGISSRVSLNNPASLQSNLKLGFRPIEEYFDKNMHENRYYLICPFGKHDPWKYLD
jgi:RimJ/RimL family protein N-acetyltransferase